MSANKIASEQMRVEQACRMPSDISSSGLSCAPYMEAVVLWHLYWLRWELTSRSLGTLLRSVTLCQAPGLILPRTGQINKGFLGAAHAGAVVFTCVHLRKLMAASHALQQTHFQSLSNSSQWRDLTCTRSHPHRTIHITR